MSCSKLFYCAPIYIVNNNNLLYIQERLSWGPFTPRLVYLTYYTLIPSIININQCRQRTSKLYCEWVVLQAETNPDREHPSYTVNKWYYKHKPIPTENIQVILWMSGITNINQYRQRTSKLYCEWVVLQAETNTDREHTSYTVNEWYYKQKPILCNKSAWIAHWMRSQKHVVYSPEH